MKASIYALPLLLIVILASCVGISSDDLADLSRPLPNIKFEQVLREAKITSDVKSMNLYILAADMAMQQKYPAYAQDILDELNKNILPKEQEIYSSVIAADLAVQRKQPKTAIALLSKPIMAGIILLPKNYQIRSHLVKAQAFEDSGQIIAAVKERVFISSILNDQQKVTNNTQIWNLLTALPELKLRKTGDLDLDIWQELVRSFNKAETVRQQQLVLHKWLQQYPNHPGAQALPEPLAKLPIFANTHFHKIALVLPKSGKSKAIADNIRHGFMAAHLAAKESSSESVEIIEIDADKFIGVTVKDFYKELKEQGINTVVGPLDKAQVNKLAQYKKLDKKAILPLPTLALNYADEPTLSNNRTPLNMFEFGLAVEDEIKEVVLKAKADGHKRAIALVPNTAWGDKVLKEFRTRWQDTGGLLLAYEKFDRPADLSDQIAYLLRINQSAKRGEKLTKVLGRNKFEFKPTRRQDVDFIFMVANPKQAQQIKPTLNYHYAKDLPVYATSLVYNTNLTMNQYADLNGIIFCDAPWILKTDTSLRLKVDPYWQDATGTVGRLYAMGADAYNLAVSIEQMEESQTANFEGLSGYLQLNEGKVSRRLTWAHFTGLQIRLLEEAAY